MRSGYQDISLFKENLLASQQAGAKYIALHPRTKIEGYGPPARWDLIKEAKSLLNIPVIGNGDIKTVEDALSMLEVTGCDALMIGRGAIINPFIFHEIKAHFAKEDFSVRISDLQKYLEAYFSSIQEDRIRLKVNKLKQLFGFIFKSNPNLLEKRQGMLRSKIMDPHEFFSFSFSLLEESWVK